MARPCQLNVAGRAAATRAVDELVSAGLVQARTTPFLSIRPQHALVRAAVDHQTPLELRRVLHRRAAEIVDAPASLDHRLAAADSCDAALAVDLEARAADLHDRCQYRQAAHYWDSAVVSAYLRMPVGGSTERIIEALDRIDRLGITDAAHPRRDAAVERCRVMPCPENRLLLLITLVVRCHAEGAPRKQIDRLTAEFDDLDSLVTFAQALDSLMLVHAGLAAPWMDRPAALQVRRGEQARTHCCDPSAARPAHSAERLTHADIGI